jgi:hypothetical protein
MNRERTIYYTEPDTCNIFSPLNLTGADSPLAQIEFSEDDLELQFYFDKIRNLQEQIETSIETEDDGYPYVDFPKKIESCLIYDDYDEFVLILAAGVALIYITIAIILICYCVKLRKIQKDYSRLVEDTEGSDNSSKDRVEQQLELEIKIKH